ncbi:hypothetical protein TUM20985_17890 [Mycobacterium antarcticum]|nr:hypothetical protein TUM20985_17890 [Mycolicibacterium sp. TUM20985]
MWAFLCHSSTQAYRRPPTTVADWPVPPPGSRTFMTQPAGDRREEHLDASEDDGSAQLEPEDGGIESAAPEGGATQGQH